MKLSVTEHGLTIPKHLLKDIKEVDVHEENGRLVIVPIDEADPILGLGEQPVSCGVSDASSAHDRYLYGSSE